MSLAKVIEVLAEGTTIEEAVQSAVTQASKTVHDIKSLYIQETQAIVENGRVAKYRINAKITFVLEEK